jgi:hypothetical protein
MRRHHGFNIEPLLPLCCLVCGTQSTDTTERVAKHSSPAPIHMCQGWMRVRIIFRPLQCIENVQVAVATRLCCRSNHHKTQTGNRIRQIPEHSSTCSNTITCNGKRPFRQVGRVPDLCVCSTMTLIAFRKPVAASLYLQRSRWWRLAGSAVNATRDYPRHQQLLHS